MEEIGAFINRISVGVRLFGFYDPLGRCGGFFSFKGPFVQNRCRPEVGFGGSFFAGQRRFGRKAAAFLSGSLRLLKEMGYTK